MRGSRARREALNKANAARMAKQELQKANNPTPTDDPPDVEMESDAESEPQRYNLRHQSSAGSYNPTPSPQPTPAQQQARAANIRNVNRHEKTRTRREQLADARNIRQDANPTAQEFAEEQILIIQEADGATEDLEEEIHNRYQAVGNVLEKSDELAAALEQLKIVSEKQKQLNNEKYALQKKFEREVEKQKKTNKNLQRKINRREFMHKQARKPFTSLESRNSRLEAVKRFMSIVTTFFTCYLFTDFFAISRLAWPNFNAPFSLLSPAQTWQFMSELNISFTKMRVIKRFLKECGLNVFASEGHVYQLIKLVANATKSFVEYVQSKDKVFHIRCASIESLKQLIKQRVIAQMKGGKFPTKLKHLRLCIGFDKGGTTTKMCLMMGSIKGRNGPRNMSLLALYEGNESPEELMAAFQQIINECKKIKRIRVGARTIKVSFRFTGDLKCLKACLGLKAGNANYPCLFCLQLKETTFGNYSTEAGQIRENYLYNGNESLPGQGHCGCLSWIKPHQIVLPSLHLMMGVAEKIFDLLISRICIKEAITGSNGFDMEALREKHEEFAEASDELKAERERLNEWEGIKEKFQGVSLPVHEKEWPEGCNRRKWFGDICCSSNCISKISDLILPCRNIIQEEKEVPDWLQSADNMWFHSICLGLSGQEAIDASNVGDFRIVFKPKEILLSELQNEIDRAAAKVREAQINVQTALLSINMPKEFDNHPTVNSLFKIFEKFGAYKTAFFQRFTGNHIRALLDSAVPEEDGTSKLHKKLMECDILKCFIIDKNDKYDEKFKLGMDALHKLALIQDMFKSDILTDDEIKQLRDDVRSLESIMKNLPEVRVGHKFHLILKHIPSVAERDKTIGFFSEHGIESMHALVNQLMRRLTVRSNETRLERIIQYVNSIAVTRDQYGEIDPLKKKKLEREKKAAAAMEMLEDAEDEYDDEDLLFPEDFATDDEVVTDEETIVIEASELAEAENEDEEE